MSLKYLNDLLVEVEAKESHNIDGGCTWSYEFQNWNYCGWGVLFGPCPHSC
jgi:hypothetical protein